MKTLIFTIMTFFMFSPLGASTETLLKNELSLGYSNKSADIFSAGIFGVKPDGIEDLEFKVGMSNGVRGFENTSQIGGNLVERVVVWVSYRF